MSNTARFGEDTLDLEEIL